MDEEKNNNLDQSIDDTDSKQSVEQNTLTQSSNPEGPADFSEPPEQIDLSQPFSWQATEYTHQDHSSTWYIVFGSVFVVLLAIAIFAIKNITFIILLPVMATAVLLLIKKPARVINYSISPKGIYVGDRLYDYSEFKSFSITIEPTHAYITLLPTTRIGLGLTLYFSDSDGEKIVDLLGARIPMQDIKPNMIDKLARIMRL